MKPHLRSGASKSLGGESSVSPCKYIEHFSISEETFIRSVSQEISNLLQNLKVHYGVQKIRHQPYPATDRSNPHTPIVFH